MNKDLLPQEWKDDAMHSLSDNRDMEMRSPLWPDDNPIDANSIEDYDNFDEVPVMDYNGRNIGYRAVPKRNKKK